MILNRSFSVVLNITCVLGLMFSACLVAQDSADDLANVCVACHGAKGVSSNPLVPTLAGQPFTLIEDNLLAFRSQRRVCAPGNNDQGPSAILAQTMCNVVANLDDQEVEALAEYFEQQQFIPAVQAADSTLAARGRAVHAENGCDHCHSKGGTQSNSMAPILAGQWAPYLRRSMDALQSGSRKGPKVMNAAIHALEKDEVEALLNYYASQQDGIQDNTNP